MIIFMLCALLFVGGSQSLSAAPVEGDFFSEAESRYLGKNYTAALESYDAFLAAYPLSERLPDVQYRRATCMYRLEGIVTRSSLSAKLRSATAERATSLSSLSGKASHSTSLAATPSVWRASMSFLPDPGMRSSRRRRSCTGPWR